MLTDTLGWPFRPFGIHGLGQRVWDVLRDTLRRPFGIHGLGHTVWDVLKGYTATAIWDVFYEIYELSTRSACRRTLAT